MRSEKDRIGQDRTGQDRTGQDRTGQNSIYCKERSVPSVRPDEEARSTEPWSPVVKIIDPIE